MHRITIVRIRRPATQNIHEELQWLGSSLGLFNLRDKDKSCFRLFIELIRATKRNEPMTSDQLAYQTHLSRGTVVHHLHKLRDAGIVVYEDKGYKLRVEDLRHLVEEIEKDLTRTCEELRGIAEEIDKKLGI